MRLGAGEKLGSSFWHRFGVCAPLCSCMDVSVLGCRGLEEELRTRLQWEEARLEQRRAQLLRSQETLLELETGLDNLWVRLRGIPVPGQVPAQGWAERSPGSARGCSGTVRSHLVQQPPPDGLLCPTKNKALLSLAPGASCQGHGSGREAPAV